LPTQFLNQGRNDLTPKPLKKEESSKRISKEGKDTQNRRIRSLAYPRIKAEPLDNGYSTLHFLGILLIVKPKIAFG